jgi:hypothetical protein
MTQTYTGRWRIVCNEPCGIEDGPETTRSGRLWNVSVAGAYVVLPQLTVELGQRVRLFFCLPGELIPIRVTARVAWINPPSREKEAVGERSPRLPPGCGLEFIDLAQIDRTRITARVQGS